IFARKSATWFASAAWFCANIALFRSSFESMTGMTLRPLESRQACRQQHEQRADRARQPASCARAFAKGTAGGARQPRNRQVDEQAVEIEEAAEQHERQRFGRRIGADELRQE